jgi:hypothetical protein
LSTFAGCCRRAREKEQKQSPDSSQLRHNENKTNGVPSRPNRWGHREILELKRGPYNGKHHAGRPSAQREGTDQDNVLIK